MILDDLNLWQTVLIWAIPLLFAVTVHEVAHGWVAWKLGDNTARAAGRLTLNPLSHIDPIGTIVVPSLLYVAGGFVFGWARPVPVDWRNLQRPKTDMVYVALAGPLANLCMALGWLLVLRIGMEIIYAGSVVGVALLYLGKTGVLVNLLLMLVNLLPVLPLDGGRVVAGLLPAPLAGYYAKLTPLGLPLMVALIALIHFDWLPNVFIPPLLWFERLLYSLAGVI